MALTQQALVLSEHDLAAWVAAWTWPFARIAALVTAAPVFGYRAVPVRIKLGVALVLTAAVAGLAPPMPVLDPLAAEGLLVTAQQVLVGLSMGFALRLAFLVLEVAGQQIAQLMGLGFASMADPQNGIEVPVVSHFYIVLATLVFLSIDGHLAVVRVLIESFRVLPVGVEGIDRDGLWALTGQAGWVFAAGLRMALPAMAAMLTVNLAFGVMARSAPQLNIFVVGFPVTLLFGMAVMLLTVPAAISGFEALFEHALEAAGRLLGGAG